MFKLKDRIDRRFMERFQVLREDGGSRSDLRHGARDGWRRHGLRRLRGQGGRVHAQPRAGAAGRRERSQRGAGAGVPDDVAAVATERGEIVVSSVDGFRGFTDDPYLVGRVAAVNAASDLWSQGATPRWALASVEIPTSSPPRAEETLYQTPAGARAALDADGITLVGGHTTSGATLHVGFCGAGDGALRRRAHAQGRRVPPGSGSSSPSRSARACSSSPTCGPRAGAVDGGGHRLDACAAMPPPRAWPRAHGASACTDVSGFGPAGHLGEMLRASKCAAVLDLAALPLLPGAGALLARGDRSTFHPENAKSRRALRIDASAQAHPALDILFDPQTSGGLLFAVPAERAEAALAALRAAGDGGAALIGEVTPPRAAIRRCSRWWRAQPAGDARRDRGGALALLVVGAARPITRPHLRQAAAARRARPGSGPRR